MFALAVTFFYCVGTLFAGYCVLHLIGYRNILSNPEEVLVLVTSSFMLGLGILSNMWLLIGLASWLTPTVVAALLAGFLALGIFLFHRLRIDWITICREIAGWFMGLDRSLGLLILVALVLLVLLGIGAFLRPPMGDAEAFYMTYPKIIAASHRVAEMPGGYANFSQIGLLGEMHFAALFELGELQAAKLFVWPVAIATIVMLLAMAKYAGLGRSGLCFVFLLAITSTAFTSHITDGKVDLFAAAVGVGAAYWALRIGEPDQGNLALRVAGLLAGFAVLGKLSYLPALLPPLALIVAWNAFIVARQLTGQYARWAVSIVRPMTLFTLWFMVGIVPHVIKNAVLFGAPLAPIVGGEGTAWLNQTWFSEEDTRWIVMTYPLALTFGRYPMQGGNLSILGLAFLPLAFAVQNIRSFITRPLAQTTSAGILGTVLWMALRPSVIAPRYILATLFLLVPLVAKFAERVYETESRPRILSKAMVVTVLLALVIVSSPQARLLKPVSYLAPFLRGSFPICALASPYCEPLTELNRLAERGDRVYFLGHYSYWLRPDLLQCRDGRQDEQALLSVAKSGDRWATLYARGFRYVIVDRTTHDKAWGTLSPIMVPQWLEVSEIIRSDDLSVLALKARESDRRVEVSCAQVSPPAWDLKAN